MNNFILELPKTKNNDTIVQTIRFSGTSYDIIKELASNNGVSFNYVVNEMIKYAISNMGESGNEKRR